ncbi:MAG: DNA methyltransferase [Magnetospirillum sp.]
MAQLEALYDLGLIVFSKHGRPKYKQYLGKGILYQDIWAFQPGTERTLFGNDAGIDQDLKWLDSETERLGYPTQKPLGLLKRIIETSTNQDAVILDPFCGCGTAIHAAQQLKRNWIGIDITHLAIQVIEDRLNKHFPTFALPDVIGRPYDVEAARDLARRDKYQFQWWATWLVGGRARGGERKGADRGVDGDLFFSMGRNKDGHGIISVKGGANLGPQMVRDLKGTRERESADVGIFVCLEEPTSEMRKEAAACESLQTPIGPVPKIQIYSIRDLLAGAAMQLPPIYSTITAAEVARERRPARTPKKPSPKQREMLFPVPGSYSAAKDAPLLEAAEEAVAFDHERQQVTRRRKR